MKTFDGGDSDTAIEEYPGVLGYTWDGELCVIDPVLKPLADFDFSLYDESIEERGVHQIPVEIDGRVCPMNVEPYADIAALMEQIDSIEVCFDPGPPDSGPASGAGYIFFLKDDYSCETASVHIGALVDALRSDMAKST